VHKTSTVGTSRRGICSVLSSEHVNGSFTETHCVEFTWGETIHFGSLEFITNRFDTLSLSPEGNDLGVMFMEMVHNGSPSLHTILEESTGEDNSASSGGGSSSFPISRSCNVVIPAIPITTTPLPEGTPVLLTIPTVPLRTTVPQPDTGLLPKLLWAY
jgi:hypothetical protein